jgi:hypothetical protein
MVEANAIGRGDCYSVRILETKGFLDVNDDMGVHTRIIIGRLRPQAGHGVIVAIDLFC